MKAAQLRDTLVRYIRERDSQAVIATEVALQATLHFPHAAVADVYVLSADGITIWEIKGEGDTYRRLTTQIPVYKSHAQRVNVLVSPTLEARLHKHVPDDVGLYSVDAGEVVERRPAQTSSPKLASVASMLEKPRLMLFAKAFGLTKAPNGAAAAGGAFLDSSQLALGMQAEESLPAPSPMRQIVYRREPYKHELEEIVATRIAELHGDGAVLNALCDELRKWFTKDEEFRRAHVQHANRTSPTLLAGEVLPHDNGYCRLTVWFGDHHTASDFYWTCYHVDGVFADSLLHGRSKGAGDSWCVRLRVPASEKEHIAAMARERGALPIGGLAAKAS